MPRSVHAAVATNFRPNRWIRRLARSLLEQILSAIKAQTQ